MCRQNVAGLLAAGLVTLVFIAGCSPGATAAPTTALSSALPSAVVTAAPTATPVPATPSPTASPTPWTSDKAAAVVGTMDCNTVVKPGAEPSPGTPPFGLAHQIIRCVVTASDPRVNGTGLLDLNLTGWDPMTGNNAITWLYQEIKGPDGSWAGRGYGIYDGDGTARASWVLVGSGAYKGLVFAFAGTVPGNTGNVSVTGVVQPGPPPPGFPTTPLAAWPAS